MLQATRSPPTPRRFLGPEHVAATAPTPALLVKLLDAGERLPVHYHPGRAFAREHLGLRYGKTEAWLILEAEPGRGRPRRAAASRSTRDDRAPLGRRAGRRRDARRAARACRSQAGDAILVPAGTLHAIGGGILLLELQEPTDLSVLVEWKRFGVDSGPEHLELGWDTALQSLDREPIDPAALTRADATRPAARRRPTPTSAPSGQGAATPLTRASRSCS